MTEMLDQPSRSYECATTDDVRKLADPEQQFIALNPYTIASDSYARYKPSSFTTEGQVDELIDFAADPEASGSLLVRAQALEIAFDRIEWLRREDPSLTGLSRKASIMLQLLPHDYRVKISSIQNPVQPDLPWDYGLHDFDPYIYRQAARDLAHQEGISEDLLFPDWHMYSGDPLEMPDCNPAKAFLMLNKLADLQAEPSRLPISSLSGLIPLALDINSRLATQSNEEVEAASKLRNDSRAIYELSRLTGAEPYIQVLERLKASTAKLRKIFPPEYGYAAERGANALITKSVYAIAHHLTHGNRSKATLPLNGRYTHGLSIDLKDNEPLEILSSLDSVINQLYDQVSSGPAVTGVANESDYRLYRLWKANGSSNISLYVRPYGALGFDRGYEYGNSQGVEASISYVIDPVLGQGKLLPLGRHNSAGPDNRVSIRLDREGVIKERRGKPDSLKDPTQQQGTLSLDIGSVLGNMEDLGTRIGRFLAWGDLLRAEANGETTQLNHVTQYFGELHGDADYFAGVAHKLIEQCEARRVGVGVIKALLSRNLVA